MLKNTYKQYFVTEEMIGDIMWNNVIRVSQIGWNNIRFSLVELILLMFDLLCRQIGRCYHFLQATYPSYMDHTSVLCPKNVWP